MARHSFYESAEAALVQTYAQEPAAPPPSLTKTTRKATPRQPVAKKAKPRPLAPALAGKATPLTIIAQDPLAKGTGDKPLLATVNVPAGRVLPGPRDHRFFVVDYDPEHPTEEPTRLTMALEGERDTGWRLVDRFARASRRRLITDPDFHAQNIYAISAGLLARFEEVLGRRIPWRFGSHHLYLVPHAFVGANAGYSPDDHAIQFGYVPEVGRSQEPIYTCLSHDVIAHELTHAILDGLRPRYIEPGLPDQMAFHEGFADIVALLAVFARSEIVAQLLAGDDTPPKYLNARRFKAEHLRRTALFTVGEQLGREMDPTRYGLRQSLADVPRGRSWMSDLTYGEPHRRGEVLVAVISDVVAEIWSKRLHDLHRHGQVPLERAAEEGAKVAGQILGMCIRALDYLPPIEFEFPDFLDAIVSADEVVVPDDSRHYRDALTASFARYGIKRTVTTTPNKREPHPWRYQSINFKALGTSTDEVYRFLWQNADRFGIDLDYYLDVERVLAVTRTGPDGLIVEEIIADYIQNIAAPLTEFPDDWTQGVKADPDTEVQAWGGGVVVFDQYGNPRQHVCKPLLDPKRQNRRLKHLAGAEAYDTRGRLGFSYGVGNSRQFALLHDPATKERW